MHKKTLTAVILSASIISCGKTVPISQPYSHEENTITISAEGNLPDCSGYKSHLTIPFGLSTPTGQKQAGQRFGTMMAVDKKDGTMKITILPPDGANGFPTQLLDEFSDYTIKIVACKTTSYSVMNGFSTTGVCSTIASINIVGKSNVTSANFTNNGFVVDGIRVHSTAIPNIDRDKKSIKPNLIMVTASLMEQNSVGDIMLAYGHSPYAECYNYGK